MEDAQASSSGNSAQAAGIQPASNAKGSADASAKDDHSAARAAEEEIQPASNAEGPADASAATDEHSAARAERQKSLRFGDSARPSVRFLDGDVQQQQEPETSSLKHRASSLKTKQNRLDLPSKKLKFVGEEETQQEEEHENAEDYDPYHGQGASEPLPEFPMFLVFHLMNAQRFRNMSEAKCRGRIKWCRLMSFALGLPLAVGLALCLALLILHIRHHPKLPILNVEALDLMLADLFPVKQEVIEQQQLEGKGNYYAYRLNMALLYVLNITNPNKYVDFHHDFVELTLLYRGMPLGVDRVEQVFLPRDSVKRPTLLVAVIGLRVPLDVGYTLKPELAAVDFEVVTEVVARSRMSLMAGIKSPVFWVRFRCQLHQTPEQLFQNCKYLNADKWRSSNQHLKVYRTPAWPQDLETYKQRGGFPVPAEYYDDDYNYYYGTTPPD